MGDWGGSFFRVTFSEVTGGLGEVSGEVEDEVLVAKLLGSVPLQRQHSCHLFHQRLRFRAF